MEVEGDTQSPSMVARVCNPSTGLPEGGQPGLQDAELFQGTLLCSFVRFFGFFLFLFF